MQGNWRVFRLTKGQKTAMMGMLLEYRSMVRESGLFLISKV